MATRDEIMNAACARDTRLLREMAAGGADFNETDKWGTSLLSDVLETLYREECPFRYEVATLLVELGADVNILDREGSGPLNRALLHMDTKMLRFLLDAGADPNPNQFVEFNGESLYDDAEFDYRWLHVFFNGLPEKPTDEDHKSEESWLAFLDRLAIKYNVRRPDYLFLLRVYGGRRRSELEGNTPKEKA